MPITERWEKCWRSRAGLPQLSNSAGCECLTDENPVTEFCGVQDYLSNRIDPPPKLKKKAAAKGDDLATAAISWATHASENLDNNTGPEYSSQLKTAHPSLSAAEIWPFHRALMLWQSRHPELLGQPAWRALTGVVHGALVTSMRGAA